ncbi:MAG: VWA domain-containing protein, partial [Candidatus Omnitrophica bacterium]|nr:VWA domain-containing protein [Candidatus Omnitrophota bacterium]
MERGQGTNDAEAVELAIKELENQEGDSKIAIVITDGQGNGPEKVSKYLDLARKKHIEVIGIGIGEAMGYVRGVYRPFVLVREVEDLPKVLAKILIDIIVHRRPTYEVGIDSISGSISSKEGNFVSTELITSLGGLGFSVLGLSVLAKYEFNSWEDILITVSGLLALACLKPLTYWLIRPISVISDYFNRLKERKAFLISPIESDKPNTSALTVEEVKNIFKEAIKRPSDTDIISVVGRNATSRWYSAVRQTIKSTHRHPIIVYYPGAGTDIIHPLLTTDGEIFLYVDIGESKEPINKLLNSISNQIEQLGGKVINMGIVNDNEGVINFELGDRNRVLYYYNKIDASDENLLPQKIKEGFDIYVEKALLYGYTGAGTQKELTLPIALKYLRQGGFVLTDYSTRRQVTDPRLKTVGIEYVEEKTSPVFHFTHLTYFVSSKEQSRQQSDKITVQNPINDLFDSNLDIRNGAAELLAKIGNTKALTFLKLLQEKESQNQIVAKAVKTSEEKAKQEEQAKLKARMPDPFAKVLFTLDKEENLVLTLETIHTLNVLGIGYDKLILEIDVSKGIYKGIKELQGDITLETSRFEVKSLHEFSHIEESLGLVKGNLNVDTQRFEQKGEDTEATQKAKEFFQATLEPALEIIDEMKQKRPECVVPVEFRLKTPNNRLGEVIEEDGIRKIIFSRAIITPAPPQLLVVLTLAEEILHYFYPQLNAHAIIDNYITAQTDETFRKEIKKAERLNIYYSYPFSGKSLVSNCLVDTIANINNLDKDYVASLFAHLPIMKVNNEICLPFNQALEVMRANNMPFAGIWVRKIGDKLWHASSKKEGFKLLEEVLQEIDTDDYIGFGQGSSSRYHYADMVIGVFPKKIIKKGSSYVLRDYEDRLEEVDKADLNLKKINKAIELWGKESEKEENIIEYFKERVTIVEVDLPLPFLLLGKDEKGKIYWQLTKIGVDREIIYIPKMFLDQLSIDNIEDTKKLAHILNHDTIEIMEYTKILKEKSLITAEDIENIHNEYGLKDDLFGMRDEINNYFENNIEANIEIIKGAENELRKNIENKEREIDSWFATNQRRKIHNGLFVLKLRLASLKDMQRKDTTHNKEIIKAYNDAIDELKKIEYNDYGILPLYVQIRIVYLYAKLGEFNKLIKAMKDLVSMNFGRKISNEERQLHQHYLKTNFSGIKKKVVDILEYNKQIFLGEGNYRAAEDITEAIEKINKLEVIT